MASQFSRDHFARSLPFADVPAVCTSGIYLSGFFGPPCLTVLRSFDVYSGFTFSWYCSNDSMYSGIYHLPLSTLVIPTCHCDSRALILPRQNIFDCRKALLSLGLERILPFSLAYQLGCWNLNNLDIHCQKN